MINPSLDQDPALCSPIACVLSCNSVLIPLMGDWCLHFLEPWACLGADSTPSPHWVCERSYRPEAAPGIMQDGLKQPASHAPHQSPWRNYGESTWGTKGKGSWEARDNHRLRDSVRAGNFLVCLNGLLHIKYCSGCCCCFEITLKCEGCLSIICHDIYLL